MHKLDHGSCWSGRIWATQGRGEGAGLVRTAEAVQVSQGWLDRRLNIATENMNKTNLIPTVPLPPSITYNSRISEWSSGPGKPDTLTVKALISPWKLGCTSCKHSDLNGAVNQWQSLTSVGWWGLSWGRATIAVPGRVWTVGCQSYAHQQCGTITTREQLEHQEDDIDRLMCGGVHS